MARYNEILVGRYNRYLQKLLSMKGEAPSPQLASEIGVHLVLFHGIENLNLQGWDIFGVNVIQGGVVGIVSRIRVRNPANSNVVAVFQRITIEGPTLDNAATIERGVTSVDLSLVLTFVGAPISLDPRGRVNPTCITSRTDIVAGASLTSFQPVGTQTGQGHIDAILSEGHEIPLLPGSAIQVTSSVTNSPLTIGWMWRERLLEDSERA